MLLIPAIDLKDGACVRLRQGEMSDSTVYSEDPSATARRWLEAGARRLHIVDLNGAFAGRPENEPAIRAITEAAGSVPVQLGGGIRDLETIEAHLNAGISYVILGTAAVRNPGFVRQAATEFPGHVMVGLDARDGKVAVEGWSKVTGHDVADLAKKFEDYGVEAIVYTDIGRDGMLSGPNVGATAALARSLRIPVIASGGIHTLEDIRALKDVEEEGVSGAITGRAIYEGTLDFAEAREVAQDHAG
ncbi:1-(5-phosphoribosyl)-5-[(5-phosphoribosylamino)methylideneamino]imidazole-4-carboxamide isomerase [Thiohalorhabdus methylotrophus]|uniref:1-(5-phosphoribosyl)-5-[(5-phosphoribosylamino)methylideneamino] imidazole-4-carboxamide isomerase n=1 Tax=Thiohalorhabdus methylotrophus TaxID=3242694 RepID=A0ABV4TX06_9GAMM